MADKYSIAFPLRGRGRQSEALAREVIAPCQLRCVWWRRPIFAIATTHQIAFKLLFPPMGIIKTIEIKIYLLYNHPN